MAQRLYFDVFDRNILKFKGKVTKPFSRKHFNPASFASGSAICGRLSMQSIFCFADFVAMATRPTSQTLLRCHRQLPETGAGGSLTDHVLLNFNLDTWVKYVSEAGLLDNVMGIKKVLPQVEEHIRQVLPGYELVTLPVNPQLACPLHCC